MQSLIACWRETGRQRQIHLHKFTVILNIYGSSAVVWRRDNLVNNEYTMQDIEDYVVQPVNIVGSLVQDWIVLRQIKGWKTLENDFSKC